LKKIFKLTSFRIGIFLTILVMVIYFFDPLFLRLIELKTLDMKFISRGQLKPGNEVIIATIDEKSLDELGRWPWPRSILVKMVDILSKYGAKAIGFDAVFPEPQDSNLKTLKTLENRIKETNLKDKNLEDMINREKGNVDYDKQFANSIKKSNNVILGYFFHMHQEELKHKKKEELDRHIQNIIDSNYQIIKYRSRKAKEVPFHKAYAAESSIKILSDAAKSSGHFNFIPDDDGSMRRIPLVIKYQDRLFPHISLIILKEYLGSPNIALTIADYGMEEIKLGDLIIPTNELGDMLVNFYGPARTFPQYSITDIIHERIDPENFKDKIVLVGSTAVGIQDIRVTPFDKAFPGVEMHANVIDNILHKKFILRPDWIGMFEIFIVLLLGIILSLLLPRFKAIHGLAFVIFLIVSYFFVDRYIFTNKGLWLNLVYPIFTIMIVYSGITIFRYMTEEREKKFIRAAFGQYLSPKVIEQLTENPELLKLGGEERILTALFSDVAGFSTISENLKPEELVELLNDYLTEMTEIILRYEGTLDKYEGDAIIAFFGAPISMDDHAKRACLVAIEMQKRLNMLRDKWKKEGRPQIFCRIGLNTGPMVVGNMGSKNRMDYTIMGDAVNLGSRLEGVNKDYNTSIIISEDIFKSVKDNIEARELDIIRVKGRVEPVKIYELIDKKGEIDSKKTEILKIFQDGLSKYRERNWEDALNDFKKALELDKNDGPSKVYVQRCEKFIKNPPPDNWDGVFGMEIEIAD